MSENNTEMHWFDSPDDELEYVGVFDEAIADECQHWTGEKPRPCEDPATHTTVYRGKITVEIASCDEHGVPEHAGKSLYFQATKEQIHEDLDGDGE